MPPFFLESGDDWKPGSGEWHGIVKTPPTKNGNGAARLELELGLIERIWQDFRSEHGVFGGSERNPGP